MKINPQKIVGQFVVTIHVENELPEDKMSALCDSVSDALDEIQFRQLIRQKFEEHLIGGVKIDVSDY
jgi:hypothetical protein